MRDLAQIDFSIRDILRILAPSAKEYRRDIILTPVIVLFEVVFEVLIPFRTAALVDAIKAGATVPEIISTGNTLILMALASLICGTLAGITCANASAGFSKNLRRDMFHNIQSFSFAVIDRFSNSSLVTRLTTDVTQVQMAFMLLIRTAIRAPFMLILSFIAAYVMGGWLSLIFVVTLPLLGFGLWYIFGHAIPFFRRIFHEYDLMNEAAEENLTGIRVVKSYVRESFEKQKFATATEVVRKDFTAAERLLALNAPFMNFFVYVLMASIIYFGSYAIITTKGSLIDVGQMSSLISFGFMMLMSLMMLSMIFAMVAMAEESTRRICEVLSATTTITEKENALSEVQDGSIDFKDVAFSYSQDTGREALSNINLHINSGEVVGIIGATGSAKSSLVQLIARLYDVTEGAVFVGGKDVRDYKLKVLRDEVAMVLQKNVLFSGTIAENLRWGNPHATDAEVKEAAELAQAAEFIDRFPEGYDTYIEQGGSNVSGGQKQRLCIARALLKRPKILIMDDSTSAVDTKTDRLIRDGLKNYLPKTTKIIIAQRTSSVEDADKIVVMKDGHIDTVGTHDELLRSNEIYREVYISQNKKSHDDNQEVNHAQ